MKKSSKSDIQKTKKENLVKIIITSVIAAVLSVGLGTIIGLIDFDFSSIPILQGLLWILNVFISYSIAFLISKLYKSKFSFLNIIALGLSYTLSVLLVVLISGSFEFTYVTSYLTAIAFIGAVHGLITLYKSKKNFYK